MLILVCGSREWRDQEKIAMVLSEYMAEPDLHIIHGDCRGADKMAGAEAFMLGIPVTKFPAEWDKYGKAAGPIRNEEMIQQRPDLVIAFGTGRGTRHMLDLAFDNGVPTRRVT